MNTQESQQYLSEYYKELNIESRSEDWELQKKYKNFNGFTCRDFILKDKNFKLILISENNNISIIENENFEFFARNKQKKIIFYYAPIITNDGLVYSFFKRINNFQKFDDYIPTIEDKEKLKEKLSLLFPQYNINFLSFKYGIIIALPGIDIDDIIIKLENSEFSFNKKIFEILNNNTYQAFYPDLTLAMYSFPEDEKLLHEEAIDLLFKLSSIKKVLVTEDYARIKKLLKKVNADEIMTVGKIIKAFKPYDKILKKLIEEEVSLKKSLTVFLAHKNLLEKTKAR